MKTTLLKIVPAALAVAFSSNIYASDQADLDDIKNWKLVSIETCLDAALDTVPGHARKVEFKMEGDTPVYEFDIETPDGTTYNVECNAEKGFVTEIEREVAADDPTFKKYAKITEAEARQIALDFNPGKVVSNEYEIGMDGSVTYEYDIQTNLGYEVKVDVNAITGEIEEANIELYEIGMEKE
ncbi:MAG: PepSY domain-containing protein [Gammaproteobacteria bacterium]|nr:PepSY domain-containing protein [Gammaproteobacteria bacterium]